ncbi:hypothetical protein L6452_04701 [Arctium lappa]|uniref:Uncharacterized protein n=1 Tax=Arctium lappa TaxID=4217 RepID=A0ACB9EFE0_ARCLA|nr:hypothetical protein L6452_04701 [Arctium lappa]
MHSQTRIPIPATDVDHDHELDTDADLLNSISTIDNYNDHDETPKILDDFNHYDSDNDIVLDADADETGDNNPPDSFWVSNNKVSDWLHHHTFIERKASVKLVAVSRKFDPTQNRSSQRSVSFTHKPKATIIGFRQKPGHHADGKSKPNEPPDNVRLFKNRSLPGQSSVLQVTEPRSPRVSCIGRVGSMRGRARRTGFWRNVKTALLNRVRKGSQKTRGIPV